MGYVLDARAAAKGVLGLTSASRRPTPQRRSFGDHRANDAAPTAYASTSGCSSIVAAFERTRVWSRMTVLGAPVSRTGAAVNATPRHPTPAALLGGLHFASAVETRPMGTRLPVVA